MSLNLSSPEQKHIIILGAGVTGLSTSLALSKLGYKQTIIASHVPGDLAIDYTSPNAGGHWRSFASLSDKDTEIIVWDKKTYEAWMATVENGYLSQEEIDERGLGARESRNYWATPTPETAGLDGSGFWWSAPRVRDMTKPGPQWYQGGVKGFEVLDLDQERQTQGSHTEKIPEGAIFGIKYRTICLNIPRYLSSLLNSVQAQGTQVIKANVDVDHGLAGVVKDAKRILQSHDPSVKDAGIFAVINCTGLGARHFVSAHEAANIFPIRGQTVLVKGEARCARTFVGFGKEEELIYVIPRPGSGTTILGGCKEVGNWDGSVDEGLNERILARIVRWGLADELRTGKGGGFEVLSCQVGLRPGRTGGPRVELEQENNGKMEGIWMVHSYGHAGGGYQCSIGCAERVEEIVEGLSR